jgi:uncharacterized protein (DUF1501 family)
MEGPADWGRASAPPTPSAFAARAPQKATETAAAQQETTDRREITMLSIISIGGADGVLDASHPLGTPDYSARRNTLMYQRCQILSAIGHGFDLNFPLFPHLFLHNA